MTGPNKESIAYMRWLRIQVQRDLSRLTIWSSVEALAEFLLAKETISGEKTEEIIRASQERKRNEIRAKVRENSMGNLC